MGQALHFLLQFLLALSLVSSVSSQSSPATPTDDELFYGYEWGLRGPYPQRLYRSFGLSSPLAYFKQRSEECGTGYTFMSPRGSRVGRPGPMIIDSNGELVWREIKYGQATDFKVQEYQGQSYLTFWTGTDTGTFGNGSYVMLDSSYQFYRRITPVGNLGGDLHEFKITRKGTALMTIFEPAQADLTAFGIPGHGWIYDSIFQEVDIETGVLLFEWHASKHVVILDTFHTIAAEERRVDASGKPLTGIGRSRDKGFDFFHINSIDKDEVTGNYYISSRYLHTVACISPQGDILWNLGGKHNSFKDLSDGAATNFSFQHHAIMHDNNVLSLFDNGEYDHYAKNAEYSRGMVVSLDVEDMTATLVQEYIHPDHRLLASQGSMQMLPESGHVVVGWGHAPAYTDFDKAGNVLCDVWFVPAMFWNTGWAKNYRIFRTSSWVGNPITQPDVYLRPRDGTIYVSWNGATEVDTWVLQGGEESNGTFMDLSSTRKEHFEESLSVTDDMPTYLRIAAVHHNSSTLSYTEIIDRKIGNAPAEPPRSGAKALQILGAVASFVVAILLALCLWRMRRIIAAALATVAARLVRRLRLGRSAKRSTKASAEEMEVRKPLRAGSEDDDDAKGDDYELEERSPGGLRDSKTSREEELRPLYKP